jgi:hypothetical protein
LKGFFCLKCQIANIGSTSTLYLCSRIAKAARDHMPKVGCDYAPLKFTYKNW